jgi:hypothetical protein
MVSAGIAASMPGKCITQLFANPGYRLNSKLGWPAWIWQCHFVLAARPLAPHILGVPEVHPFSIKIEPDPLNERRFRWSVCEGDQILIRSPHSYATRRQAEDEAKSAMQKRVSQWRPFR